MDEEGGKQGRAGDDALDELLLAPAGVLEGLPDAVVASSAEGPSPPVLARAPGPRARRRCRGSRTGGG